jgi:cbb3-type cytochrome oxidase maturation protein
LFSVYDIPIPPVNVIFILIAVSLLVAIGFLGVFIWSIRAGQYDDEYTPSVRILFDDEKNIIEDDIKSDKNDSGEKFQIRNSKFKTKSKFKSKNEKLETLNT